MRKTSSLLLFAAAFTLLIFVPSPARSAEEDFASSALGKQLIDLGLKFLDNPGDFFFNLHSDNEDFSPLPQKNNGSLRFNFFPTFLPTTWGNLNLKVKLLNDKASVPQVDLVGMYGDLIALRVLSASSEDFRPVFNDYSLGVVVSKATNEKTRLFGGVKYSSVNLQVNFSSPVALGAFEMSSLDIKVADTFFFTGINHQTGHERYIVAQVGYGFQYKKLISRIMLSFPHLELGMDVYPEGLFVIHPFMAWHWFF